mgnify:CR=1 FL=1
MRRTSFQIALVPLFFSSSFLTVLFIEAAPAFLGAVDQQLVPDTGALGSSSIYGIGHIAVGGAEDGLDVGCGKSVRKVLFQQLIGGRDGHSAQLVQAHHGEPILIVALQHQHHPVASLDAQGLEIVGGSCGFLLHIQESEPALGHILRNVEHGQLLRLGLCQGIHHIVSEVELFFALEGDFLQQAFFHNTKVDRKSVV